MLSRNRENVLRKGTLTFGPDDYVSIDRLAQRNKVSSPLLNRRAVREFFERHASDERVAPFPLEDRKE